MALLSTDISTTVVKAALGESSDDVGTLCLSPLINKWSRHKPVKSASLGLASEDIDAMMKSVNYGLTHVEIAGIVASNFRSPSQSTLAPVTPAVWGYQKPTGGISSPYRLGDFRNYRHDAKPFLTGMTIKDWYSGVESIDIFADVTFKWGMAVYEGMGADVGYIDIPLTELNINNLPFDNSNNKWRIGLALAVGNYYYIASSEGCISDVTGTSDVYKAMVKLSLSIDIVTYLNSLKSTETTVLNFIPFIGYNLEYVIQDTATKYFKFLSNGRAFSFPKGDAVVPMNVYGGKKGTGLSCGILTCTYNCYYGGSDHNVIVNLSGSTIANSSSLFQPSKYSATFTKVILRVYIQNVASIQLTWNTANFRVKFTSEALSNFYFYDINAQGAHLSSITLASGEGKYYDICAYEHTNDTSKPMTTTLNGMPLFDGTVQKLLAIDVSLKYLTYSMATKNPTIKMV